MGPIQIVGPTVDTIVLAPAPMEIDTMHPMTMEESIDRTQEIVAGHHHHPETTNESDQETTIEEGIMTEDIVMLPVIHLVSTCHHHHHLHLLIIVIDMTRVTMGIQNSRDEEKMTDTVADHENLATEKMADQMSILIEENMMNHLDMEDAIRHELMCCVISI